MGCGASKAPVVEPKVTEVKPAKGSSKQTDAPVSRESSKVMGSTSSLRKAVQKKKADEDISSSRSRVSSSDKDKKSTSEKKGSSKDSKDVKRSSSRRSVAHSDSEDDGVVAAPRGNSNKNSRDGSAASSKSSSKTSSAKARKTEEMDSGNEEERESSANRKKRQASAQSNSSNADSGFGDEDDGMKNVITEDHSRSAEVAKANRPPTPEFMLEGRQVGSGKGDRDRVDREGSGKKKASFAKGTKNVQREDRDELPPRCESRGGCAFDIELDDDETPTRSKTPMGMLPSLQPPPSVRRKLAPIKARPMTQEELESKQQAAEDRRKRREREVIERLEARKQAAAQVQNALDSFVTKETSKAETIEQKLQASQENREEHLRQLRDRLRAKEKHAEEVRRQKREQKAVAAGGDDF
eukprot:Opistho-2@70393